MGLYDHYVVPWLTDRMCGGRAFNRPRRTVVPRAEGRVLEVGFGSGHNLPWYEAGKVTELLALEPSAEMRERAAGRVAEAAVPVRFLDLPGEQVPLDDASVDSIVVTYTICTIPGIQAAIAEMRRVLKPAGRLHFAEHGRAPDAAIARWQDRLNPLYRSFAGGCNLNRDVPALLTEGGFRIDELDTYYMRRTPRVLGYNFIGSAIPR
ncbi:MAG: class I SAM-dependent methyltransferase [Alphaproteobacteria bacterium]